MMRIAVICNNNVALPAIQYLLQERVLVSVATISTNQEFGNVLSSFSSATNTPLKLFERKGFVSEMNNWLDEIKPDVVFMMTWPFKIHQSSLDKPKYGFVNFHYGLLPYYRGVNPVFEQIRKREKNGGITAHKVDAGIDTGPVILQKTVPIHAADNFALHMNSLSFAGVEVARSLLIMLRSGKELPGFEQNADEGKYYQRPEFKDVLVNWKEMEAEDIVALINACNPWNYGAAAVMNNNMLGIISGTVEQHEHALAPGTILDVNEDGLMVCCINNKALKIPMLYSAATGFTQPMQLVRFGLQKGVCFS